MKEAIIKLKAESNLSCYKLAATFNQLYAAEHGITVGKTFVAETVRAHAYEIGQLRKRWKRQRPKSMPRNTIWAMDMTGKGDQPGHCHSILGILDHGSRMALALIPLSDRRFLTLLRWLIATIETYGKPKVIRTDNKRDLRPNDSQSPCDYWASAINVRSLVIPGKTAGLNACLVP